MKTGGEDTRRAVTPSSAITWTAEQRQVIESPVSRRLIVDAGPGTGKTATACARIAWLLTEGGLEASEIWLFSFTRTAVHELRNRIASYLPDPGAVAALRIATIDAHAWAIHSGFDGEAALSGSFDDNIERVIELVRSHEGVFTYIGSVRHLIVDEAQDVVGPRCELVLEFIHCLSPSAGVSVFSDEAQAIYGFAEDRSEGGVDGTLPEKIREFLGDEFEELVLDRVHRTRDSALLQVFRDGRRLVRDKDLDGKARLQRVRDLVQKSNHGVLGPYWEDVQGLSADESDLLLLFRRRGEALAASGNVGTLPHRLRMSGLPTCIHGWIAVLLWDWVKPDLGREDFDRLWAERLGPPPTTHAEDAWAVLVKAFGRSPSRVSIDRLVSRLASGSPTYELTLPEFGLQGPIFSTIHGSKGREAGEVRLYLPNGKSADGDVEDHDEEARIVFVGATRARGRLQVGSSQSKSIARRLEPSGRAFTPYPFSKGTKSARAAVEIGHARDIDPVGLVGRALYRTADEARTAQARIMALKAGMDQVHADATDDAHDWRFRVALEGNRGDLCYLSPSVGYDMFAIARFVDQLVHLGRTRPPRQLRYLRTFGVRTVAVGPDDPVRELLHTPWRDSGLIAAPMLMGYSMAYFR